VGGLLDQTLARIRNNHPRWRMIGGFDKTVMHRGETEVDAIPVT